MSILSTNKKLIKVGAEYSAGSGISIDNYVISVTGDVGGKTYSAGDNINIYEQDNQLYISGKDWEQDIANASANAYNAATAQIPTPFDPSYLSAQIDNKLNESDFTAWQSGQYSTDLQTIEGQINNKLDSSSFSDVSGNFLTAINIPESATWNETSNVVKESSANWDNTSDLVKESSASWNQGKTYEGISPIVVNNDENVVSAETWTFSAGSNVSFVDDNVNKITRIDVELPQPQDLSYISAQTDKANQGVDYLSGVVITALPSDMATTGDVAELAQTISETYQTKGDYLVRSDSANFYPSNNPSGFITGVDLSNYYTKDETSGKEELANAFANIPVGDPEVNAYVTSNSASIDESTDLVQSNSSTWNDVTAYQSNSAQWNQKLDTNVFTAWSANQAANDYQLSAGIGVRIVDDDINKITRIDVTAGGGTGGDMFTAYLEYNDQNQISGYAGSAFAGQGGGGNPEVENYVQTNSAQIDETVTSFQTNSSTYMVEPNLEYNAVGEISGYGNSAIAQYGAEKQWLVHDDTLVHAANSAQYALGVNLSAVAQLLGVDETVLFSGTGVTGAFSEPLSAFKKVEFHLSDDTMIRQVAILYPDEAPNGSYIVGAASVWQPNTAPVRVLSVSGNMNEFSRVNASYQWWSKADGGFAQFSTSPVKIIGIGRKS